ncbi:MAG: Ig-like domain-containing protein [Bacteroidales bacterium]|nr:Ig-like domain-containing protein [Bacteroidales bacterium]
MKTLFNIISCFAIIIIVSRCANPVPPSGGPRDTTPPLVLKCIPSNYSINFNEDKISIFFDEFFRLDDINNQIIISPPIDNLPDFKIKSKSLIIKFNEELKKNTTYNIFFGNAIVDVNENNPLSGFQYIFSTGNSLDSLSVIGNVLNAFTLNPEEGICVMLYTDCSDTIPFDSLPLMVKPLYISKTDNNGEFYLNNLKTDEYKLFALRDANSNYIYDLPNEEIAFIDSLIFPEYQKIVLQDSIKSDSLKNDTLITNDLPITFYNLYLFEEIDSTQRLVKAELSKKAQLSFIFKFPTKYISIKPLKHKFGHDWKIEEINNTKDTIIYWLKNVEQDSLILEVSDNGIVLDTVELALVKKIKGEKSIKKEKKPEKLNIKTKIKGNQLDYYKNLEIEFSYPIVDYDFSDILLIKEQDTIRPVLSFKDSIKRNLFINYEWEQNFNYTIFIKDSIFKDILNQSNDTTIINFKTRSFTDYGFFVLNIKLEDINGHYIIQLLDEEEQVLDEKIITDNEIIKYEYLNPGNYKLKAILDVNNNLKWDTGDYLKKTEPEKVFYFPGIINIRANWDVEEDWELPYK